MATISAVIRKGQINKRGLTNIKIQIIHKGQAVYLRTNHYISPEHMMPNGRVRATHPNAKLINAELTREILGYEEKLIKANMILRHLSPYQVRDLLVEPPRENIDFFKFAEDRIEQLRKSSPGNGAIYKSSLRAFREFVGNDLLPFLDFNKKLLERFESFSREKGRSVNTISIHMRSLRAIFNDAIEELNREGFDPVITNYPFRYFQIKNEPTRKRNLSVEVIRKIRDAQLLNKYEAIARDVFMLSFYLIGINMKDLFYLRDMMGDRIEYDRAKTGTRMSIKVEPEAMEIINRYRGKKYLLWFADHCQEERDPREVRRKHQRFGDQYLDHRAFLKMVNSKLKIIASQLGILEPISTYYARHSWATIARNDCRISKDDIALCLGHKDPGKRITDVYLNEDSNSIDQANAIVIRRILTQ